MERHLLDHEAEKYAMFQIVLYMKYQCGLNQRVDLHFLSC